MTYRYRSAITGRFVSKVWAWLREHPHTVSGAIWFVIGFALGKML